LIQQQAAQQVESASAGSRLVARFVADPKGMARSALKAFADFKEQPVLQFNLTQTEHGLKFESFRVLPFFFKARKGKP